MATQCDLHRHTTPRRMVFVDIENLCGGAGRVRHAYPAVREHLTSALGLDQSVVTVIGAGRQVQVEVPMLRFEWPARFVFGCGVDGADLADRSDTRRTDGTSVDRSRDRLGRRDLRRRSVVALEPGRRRNGGKYAQCLSRRLHTAATNVVELPQLATLDYAAA